MGEVAAMKARLERERDEALARAEKAEAELHSARLLDESHMSSLLVCERDRDRYREALERIRLIGIVDDGTSARVEQEIARAALADDA